ncbi:hypothetical protein KCP71_08425 [Salmonella enterica subsp. enterica]|nr:hypothetical protein KCP71_08425 [Salmonella enterica subsp. enterica]
MKRQKTLHRALKIVAAAAELPQYFLWFYPGHPSPRAKAWAKRRQSPAPRRVQGGEPGPTAARPAAGEIARPARFSLPAPSYLRRHGAKPRAATRKIRQVDQMQRSREPSSRMQCHTSAFNPQLVQQHKMTISSP